MNGIAPENLRAAATAESTMVHADLLSDEIAGFGARHALYVASPIYRRQAYGPQHPLAIARTETVADICYAFDWLPPSAMRQGIAASMTTLRKFHSADYIAALRDSDINRRVERDVRKRYSIGTMENPLFAGVFERAATTVGGSILASELALEGRIAFHPAGGTHHGRPDRASGFCYFNDPVFALLTLLDADLKRVLYVDFDAHHGDGVEAALLHDSRVYMISVHEVERWPYTGNVRSGESSRICNVPVPGDCTDSEFCYLMEQIVLPFAVAAKPQAIVITCGADALAGDPLSTMALSNITLWQAVEDISALADAVVVLGGGGYNPWTVARCWSGLWARLAEFEIPVEIPKAVRGLLSGLECDLIDQEDIKNEWLNSIEDRVCEGPVRADVLSLVARIAPANAPHSHHLWRSEVGP